ncbi:hypothetical protein [Catenibacterium sp.]|uniref:hypothetical protein n=1 Tax=Catenibacterium sp. TaxID=2049022 RepID=UPI002E7694A2|nr:hypothetical protein [Catenibacterium sp.]MEE0821891.1 hypothetical protein [Catenibacterium sp.]
MPDKKKTAPLATNGTVTTSDACNNHYDDYSTVSLDIQEDFESLTYNGLFLNCKMKLELRNWDKGACPFIPIRVAAGPYSQFL